MLDWSHDNISVDNIQTSDDTEIVIDIRGERFILSEREADALMGELSIHGAKNPNRTSRYRASDRGGYDDE